MCGAVAEKQSVKQREGDSFPSWVLDQLGIEYMLANRVAMGRVWYRRGSCGYFRRRLDVSVKLASHRRYT